MVTGSSVEPRHVVLAKVGGIAFLMTALAYLVCLVLTRFTPPASGSAESYLTATAGSFWVVCTLWAVYMVSDVVLVPALIALFVVLRGGNRVLVLIGTALVGGYLVFDIAITEPNWLVLANLARDYAAANVHDQAAYVGAAQYGLALVPFVNALSFLISGAGFLLISIAMLHSPFRRSTAIFGIAVMALSMVAAISWFVPPMTIVISAVLSGFSLWCAVVGAQLYRMASRSEAKQQAPSHAPLRAATP
jgi:hypothetical protein